MPFQYKHEVHQRVFIDDGVQVIIPITTEQTGVIQDKISFLGFPPEIRNTVYSHLFRQLGCHISVAIPPEGLMHRSNSFMEPKGVWVPNYGFQQFYKSKKSVAIQGLSLLATCQEINQEASGVFYGYNAFKFLMTTDAFHFLTKIGKDNRERIRTLDLGWVIKSGIRGAAIVTAECKQLERLHFNLSFISVSPFTSNKSPDEVVPPFRASLKAIHARSENEEDLFKRVTWTVPGPVRGESRDERNARSKAKKDMRKKIMEVIDPKKKKKDMRKKIMEVIDPKKKKKGRRQQKKKKNTTNTKPRFKK